MSEGKRPGGLTALAVLNFVWCAGDVLKMFGFGFWVAAAHSPELSEAMTKATRQPEEIQRVIGLWRDLGLPLACALLAAIAALTVLLLLSGIGYLQQKRFLGRTLGNGYCLLSIATTIVWSAMVPHPELGGGFNIGTIIYVVYPALSLMLLNTTFREDFVR